MSSSFSAIPFAQGSADIAVPIRGHRQFTSGGGPYPQYSDEVAREAAQVAERFCANKLTPFDRKQNIFSFNKRDVPTSVRTWLGQTENSRFWQVWMGSASGSQPPKQQIGCATATCRGNTVLICRPNSPESGMPSGVDDFSGFVEPQAELDARGCEIKPKFVKKTKKMYDASLFRVHVEEAINEWLDQLALTLVQAEQRLELGAKPPIRVHQIGARRNLNVPEAFIEPLADKDRARFLKEALELGYEMYFPNGPDNGDTVLSRNETWLLARQTLEKVPLITQEGLRLIPGNIRTVNTVVTL